MSATDLLSRVSVEKLVNKAYTVFRIARHWTLSSVS
jgi:hypothetical protein